MPSWPAALHLPAEDSFTSSDPATGEPVGTFPRHGTAAVRTAVDRARPAARWWADLGFAERARRLQAFKAALARRADEVGELIHRETGKPLDGAFIEVLLSVEHLDWAARNAHRVLGTRRVRSTLHALNLAGRVAHEPHGVVGVIGPWNYPLLTPMGSIIYALAAGNAVVFKPSELTPAVGRWLAEAFAAVVPEQPVLQVVTGAGETGHALVTAGVDKVAFTGSPRTGRKVMAACAERLTPVLMECGGKDAVVVDVDADLDAAATGAVWGSMFNTGQTCAGVERVFVAEAVYEPFVARVVELAGEVRAAGDERAHLGPMTLPEQATVVREQLEDALRRGARAVVGGAESVRAPVIDPIVLVDVPPDARVLHEETFGPLVPIIRVRDADEAVERANDSPYGLGAAVFSRRRGRELARRLRAGMVSVNGVLTYTAIPALPFGGVGESGFGRVHGAEGLREFAVAKSIAEERFALPVEVWSFSRPGWVFAALGRLMRVRHGRARR